MARAVKNQLAKRQSRSKKVPLITRLRRLPRAITASLAVLAVAVIGAAGYAVTQAETAAAPLVKPNIVFVLTDDQTMDSIPKMPYVSSQTSWIKFDKGFANNGLCCPSRAAILSGQFDTHNKVGNNVQGKYLNEKELLPVWLQRAGYQTGKFGKYLNSYPFGRGLYIPPGWNNWQAAYNDGSQWGIYSQYHYKINNNGKSEVHYSTAADYMPTVLTNKAVTFIKNTASLKQPFYLEYTPSATHGPWTASPVRKGTYATAPVTRNPNFNYVAANQPAYLKAQALLDGNTQDAHRRKEWDAALSVDDTIKKIDDTLKAAGVYNNTIMIFMTDNGYAFGDHRWERKRCEFNECAQTPIWIRYPGLAGRTDTTHLVSNVDMAVTISAFAGATPAIPQDGMNFAPFVLGQDVAGWRDSVLLHWPGGDMEGKTGQPDTIPQFWGVIATMPDGGYWKYVEIDTGEKELYDENADPNEMTNLAGDPTYAAVQTDMQAKLNALKSKAGATGTLNTAMPVAGSLGVDLD
jgi:N-acetylglucosamine-6-sulfatase